MSTFSLFAARSPHLERWWKRWGVHAPSLALVFGFVWDFFLFQKPDRPLENTLILGHLALAAFGIVLLNARGREAIVARIPLILLIQFNFGALAKSLLVLYSKSGTLEGNLLFFIIFGLFVLGNEFAHTRYAQLHFHIAALYFMVLLYSMLITPILMAEISTRSFVIALIASLTVIAFTILVLRLIVPKPIGGTLLPVSSWIVGIAAGFSLLYFFNIIPPVPLSLTGIGMYHSVERSDTGYLVGYEPAPWYLPWQDTSHTFTALLGEPAFCFTSIYAPVGISTPVYHVWEQYNAASKSWEERSRISFPINGGRDAGYRAYSEKLLIEEGRWRCSVKTQRGVIIGSFDFMVRAGEPFLLEKIL